MSCSKASPPRPGVLECLPHPQVWVDIPALPSLPYCPTSQHCLPDLPPEPRHRWARDRPVPRCPQGRHWRYMLAPGCGLCTSGSQNPGPRRPGPAWLPAAAPFFLLKADEQRVMAHLLWSMCSHLCWLPCSVTHGSFWRRRSCSVVRGRNAGFRADGCGFVNTSVSSRHTRTQS